MNNDMFASGITMQDYLLMLEGAWRTIFMTLSAGVFATLLGILLGLLKLRRGNWVQTAIEACTDVMRSVPLLVQVTLVYSGLAILGTPISAFLAGTIALGLFAAGYISEVVRESILAVPTNLRLAARGLAMTSAQEYFYVVIPLGIRQGLPSWLGIILGIVKDTSVVAVIGYIELLRATQNIITRTQDPLPMLSLAAAFYFAICFPLSLVGRRFERLLNAGVTK